MMSLNWTLDTGTAFGFVTVIVAVEVPLRATVDGLKLFVIARASACASRCPADKKTRRATRPTIGVRERCDRAEVDRAVLADLAALCCTASMSRRYYNDLRHDRGSDRRALRYCWQAVDPFAQASGVDMISEADESSTGPARFMVADPDGNKILVEQHVWGE